RQLLFQHRFAVRREAPDEAARPRLARAAFDRLAVVVLFAAVQVDDVAAGAGVDEARAFGGRVLKERVDEQVGVAGEASRRGDRPGECLRVEREACVRHLDQHGRFTDGWLDYLELRVLDHARMYLSLQNLRPNENVSAATSSGLRARAVA